MTQTAPISQAVRDRSLVRFDVGDRVIAKIGHTSAEELLTVTFVQYNPRRCSMCRSDCGSYNLSGHGVRAYRACELKATLAQGETIGHRVGRVLIEIQCVRLDAAYSIVATQGTLRLAELCSSHASEIVARQAARTLACKLTRELV
jgi:hypothetical protein